MKKYFFVLISFSFVFANAQTKKEILPAASNGKDRIVNIDKSKNSLVSNIKFRSVGPTVMSGRVVDIDVNPNDPTQFYVAYASGGVWKTSNNGMSFTPVFDNTPMVNIGDIFVEWNNNETIWVGTGESNSSRSSYSGIGVFKSTDKGKSWQNLGLEETHHIGKIISNPTNSNTAWVAAAGHLFSPNKERGVYKTTDGGKTWKQTLFIDENTGVIDLEIDPSNPNILYAASWYKERRAWNFVESGKTSNIYKSTDGGETWKIISTPESGFPQGDGNGRIGLAVYPKNPNIVYAILDNQKRKAKENKDEDKDELKKDAFKTMTKEAFLKLDDKKLNSFLDENDFPKKHTAQSVKELVKSDKIQPKALAEYLEDANSMLFDTEVTGAEVYRSEDAGKTWKKTHDYTLDGLVYTYGYYFGFIKVSPVNPDKIYIAGVPILTSNDGGKTFKAIEGENTHGDHHSLWIDPNKPEHLINGNDGGINISYDDGKTWMKCNSPAVGQFYTVNVDMETPYNVYGGLQDNGVWTGPSTNSENNYWHQSGQYPFKSIMGGDGMQVAIDTRDNETVYTGYQFGNYSRVNKNTGDEKYITPSHELGERPLRWNWQSPIQISKHNADIIYFGANKLYRSFNKGDNFSAISVDLTKGGIKGDVAYGTITTIDESPLKFGMIYVGTDDGLIHLTRDNGNTWIKISDKLPQNFWVRRVIASQYNEGTVYAILNGHTWDNFTPYLFVSNDFGANWQRIGTDLPMFPINVIKEDTKNQNILYIGTDNGVYVSLDKGKSFMPMTNGLPPVAVHDLVVHPRDNDLVVGTHGRSIYIANVSYLQQLNDTLLAKDIYAFDIKAPQYGAWWGKKWSKWDDAAEIKTNLTYYTKNSGNTTIRIKTENGMLLREIKDTAEAGLNYYNYDMAIDSTMKTLYQTWLNEGSKKENKEKKEIVLKPADNKKYYLRPAKYIVEFETSAGQKTTKNFTLNEEKRRTRGEGKLPEKD